VSYFGPRGNFSNLHRTEHIDQARKRELKLKDSASTKSTDIAVDPVKIPDMNYLEINVNGKGFERGLLWKLSYWNLACAPALVSF
jgi:protein-tyrosine phosphatase